METDLIPNVSRNVQALRNIWNVKSQDETKILKPKSITYRSTSQTSKQSSIKIQIQPSISIDETIINKKPTVTFVNEGKINRKYQLLLLLLF
jgi:hypothetical protein